MGNESLGNRRKESMPRFMTVEIKTHESDTKNNSDRSKRMSELILKFLREI